MVFWNKPLPSLFIVLWLFFAHSVTAANTQEETDWLPSHELDTVRRQLNEHRMLFSYIDGRVSNGRILYKATISPFPYNMNYYYTYWGMTEDWYQYRNKELTSEGYEELFHSVFTDLSGTQVHQSTWVLIDRLPKPFWQKIIDAINDYY